MRVLVTGATGYIGGRLVPQLLEANYIVRVLVRDEKRVRRRSWSDQVEIAVGDLMEPGTLPDAFRDVDAAFYLVHSMCHGDNFPERDRQLVRNFIDVASHLKHVIYLGGLMPDTAHTSDHLASRAQVGQILRDSLPTTEFRAGPIIGSGSASFEMVRYLTERLPMMITPRWVRNIVQPIAIRDVLSYLITVLEKEPLGIVEIGGNQLTFREMMHQYAHERGLRRIIIPTPVLAPKIAALWVGLVTPVPNCLAVPLVEGVVHPLTADLNKAQQNFPQIEPLSYQHAVQLALVRIQESRVPTSWSGALGSAPDVELKDWEGLISETRTFHINVPPEKVFKSFTSVGGERGWLVWKWAWRLRGILDSLVGGPGLRRGRRDPLELLPGDALDFWRVEEVDPPRMLRLRAEMRVPGRAWLEWQAVPEGNGTRLIQTALFQPRGLWGNLYWYLLYPIHGLIFSDLVKAIAEDATPSD